MLKPQDILVMLKLIAQQDPDWTYNRVALQLDMSPSEVHGACQRAVKAGLAVREGKKVTPNRSALYKFIVDALPFVFYPERGGIEQGLPTSHSAEPLRDEIVQSGELPLVWADLDGEVRGESLTPLYKSAPYAAKQDKNLYELLVLVDAIRAGKAREKKIAKSLLEKKLKDNG